MIHTSSERIVTSCRVALSRLAYPDGTPQPDEVSGPADVVPIEGQDMNVDDVEAFARAILGAVSEARS